MTHRNHRDGSDSDGAPALRFPMNLNLSFLCTVIHGCCITWTEIIKRKCVCCVRVNHGNEKEQVQGARELMWLILPHTLMRLIA